MSKPGEQFLIRKEVYQRLRDAFHTNGIAFASRGVTVRVDSAAATIPPEAASAAAAQAIHQARQTTATQPAGG